jgi:hypothetical protein
MFLALCKTFHEPVQSLVVSIDTPHEIRAQVIQPFVRLIQAVRHTSRCTSDRCVESHLSFFDDHGSFFRSSHAKANGTRSWFSE